jgi:hypothetical protein
MCDKHVYFLNTVYRTAMINCQYKVNFNTTWLWKPLNKPYNIQYNDRSFDGTHCYVSAPLTELKSELSQHSVGINITRDRMNHHINSDDDIRGSVWNVGYELELRWSNWRKGLHSVQSEWTSQAVKIRKMFILWCSTSFCCYFRVLSRNLTKNTDLN